MGVAQAQTEHLLPCAAKALQHGACAGAQARREAEAARLAVQQFEAARAEQDRLTALPTDWANRRADAPPCLVECPQEVARMQALMRASLEPGHEGGCRVRGDLRNLRVVRVQRNENRNLLLSHRRQLSSMKEVLTEHQHSPAPLAPRAALLTPERVLDPEHNVFALWHGTTTEKAEIMVRCTRAQLLPER